MSGADKRAWFYGMGWLMSGVASGAIAIGLIVLIRWDWPTDRAEQQLTILGNSLYGMIGLMMLVILGLSIRNAIRNIKATIPGGGSLEANGHDERAE